MSLRLIEAYHKEKNTEALEKLLEDQPVVAMWHDRLKDDYTETKILAAAEDTEGIFTLLQDKFSGVETFRAVLLTVEATLPRPEEPEEKDGEEENKTPDRISIEELYQDLTGGSGVSRRYLVMVVLASLVAAIGLIKNDVAVIIGSMVIAPLLAPNMALSLATTLADFKLARRSVLTNLAGFVLVSALSIAMGIALDVDPSTPEIASRSDISHSMILLALATGVAGAYSVTAGMGTVMVGVMVAVALLPPLVASGLLLGAGRWLDGTGALLLFLVNLVCVNLAGVVTFLVQGVRPRRWWEAEKARRAVITAVAVWVALLVILAAMIYVEQRLKGVLSP